MTVRRFEGKNVIVTGAGQGIGAGIARSLAEAGADIVCAARTVADIEAVAASVQERGRRALAVPTDVTITADLEALVARTVDAYGRVDILVNNAGGWLPRAVMETSEKAFEAAPSGGGDRGGRAHDVGFGAGRAHDVGTGLGEGDRGGGTDPAARAGDDRDETVETELIEDHGRNLPGTHRYVRVSWPVW